jgi:hypothetical protein
MSTWGNDVKNRRPFLLLVVAVCSLLPQMSVVAESPVTLVINRRVVPAGSDLPVIIRVPRDSDNRSLTIEAASEDYVRSSTMPLDGEFEAATHQYWFRHLPEGEYKVVARVTGTRGVRGVAALPVSVFGMARAK